MRHTTIIEHGPRRRWWWPGERICRCGLDAYPCPVQRMLQRQQSELPVRPAWNAPTTMLAYAPMPSRGQAARSAGHVER